MNRFLALVAVLALLGGCTVSPQPTPSTSTVSVDPAAIVAARKQAGIANCPEVPNVEARSDGLPDLVLECLGGDTTVRLSGLRGKPMVINLWAQWCQPCRAEAPYLRQFATASKGKVLLLGVNYDDPRPELAVEFATQAGWKYPQLADPERQLSTKMPIGGIPFTVFVDAEGKVVHRVTGELQSYAELVQLTRDKLGVKL